MDTRKITVSNTKTQETKVVETNATTLAELKAAFDDAGIDYDGMAFYEGLTRVELIDDATLLPHDVSYKGTVTNDLVIMLTNMKGKIASGMYSRKELYSYIKVNNLAEEVKKHFGKNYTNVSSSELAEWLETDEEIEDEPCSKECDKCSCKDKETIKINITDTYNLFEFSAACLRSLAKIFDAMSEEVEKEEEPKSPYTKEELNEMEEWLKGC